MLLPEKFASGLAPSLDLGTLPPDVLQANNRTLPSFGPGES